MSGKAIVRTHPDQTSPFRWFESLDSSLGVKPISPGEKAGVAANQRMDDQDLSGLGKDARFELQSRRVKAAWIDIVVVIVIVIVFERIFGLHGKVEHVTTIVNGKTSSTTLRGPSASNWWLWASAGAGLLYYFLAELMAGQTVGKLLMGVRVTTVAGERPAATAILMRTLGRLIDWWPFFYALGWGVMRGRQTPPQRLGDWLAGTTVGFSPARP
jgi:uncharacterized RDD family membrane protein YckC